MFKWKLLYSTNNIERVIKKLIRNDKEYFIHPNYHLFAANDDGEIIYIIKQKPIIGKNHCSGYLQCAVRTHYQIGNKNISCIILYGNVFMVLYQKAKLFIILIII